VGNSEPMMTPDEVDEELRNDFFRQALNVLNESQVPFMVGGAYAFERYTGIARRTKDMDIFTRPQDVRQLLAVLARAGYGTELTDPMWLAKAFYTGYLLDIIFSSGNWLCTVDDLWLEHAVVDEVLGIPVRLCPPEEMIWQKSYIMERERFDGADVAHMIRALGPTIDWRRLLDRMADHKDVLLAHIILYRFAYPFEQDAVPAWVMKELLNDMGLAPAPSGEGERLCRGTLLSRYQYLVDLQEWNYLDARIHVQRSAAA